MQLSESSGLKVKVKFMSFVACAAPKMPPISPDGRLLPEHEELFRMKMELVFQIAKKHGHKSLILGAWGCGAFGCPPRHVAEIFGEVIDRCRDDFDIVFAVTGGNYDHFEPLCNIFSAFD